MSEHVPELQPLTIAWAARCQCYRFHNSSSGRCNCRGSNQEDKPAGYEQCHGVFDPTQPAGGQAYCKNCREECRPQEQAR